MQGLIPVINYQLKIVTGLDFEYQLLFNVSHPRRLIMNTIMRIALEFLIPLHYLQLVLNMVNSIGYSLGLNSSIIRSAVFKSVTNTLHQWPFKAPKIASAL